MTAARPSRGAHLVIFLIGRVVVIAVVVRVVVVAAAVVVVIVVVARGFPCSSAGGAFGSAGGGAARGRNILQRRQGIREREEERQEPSAAATRSSSTGGPGRRTVRGGRAMRPKLRMPEGTVLCAEPVNLKSSVPGQSGGQIQHHARRNVTHVSCPTRKKIKRELRCSVGYACHRCRKRP